MWRFIGDEDMPRSTARALRATGHAAEDVRDVGLGGEPDEAIFARAQETDAVLVTTDLGFANVLTFPLGTHAGLIVARLPNELPTDAVNAELLRALDDVQGESLRGALVILEVGRTRIRRLPSTP